MKQLYLFFSGISVVLCFHAKAQDTVRICTYNLLNYGNSANPHTTKKQWLQPILQDIKPNIVGVQEVSTALPGACDSLLPLMPFPAKRGSAHNTTGTTQLNTLLWDSTKFVRIRDTSICNSTRDISAYELYYRYPGLATYGDTIKLTVVVVHLKSSDAASDRAARVTETQCVQNYLASLPDSQNVIMMGDFNLYKSSEVAYQNLTSPTNIRARLNDPLATPGDWDGDPAFAAVHTQSPRFSTIGDGGASGGLDSRFDFILVSDAVLSGRKGIRYVSGSYKVVGNDGQHFNKAITDMPTNSSVSPLMAQNLYYMSDHLPVVAGFTFTPAHSLSVEQPALAELLRVENPFRNSIKLWRSAALRNEELWYQLTTIDGRIVQAGTIAGWESEITVGDVPKGLYFLRVISGNENTAVFRLLH